MTEEGTRQPITLSRPELVALTPEQEAEAVAALVQLLLPYAERIIEARQNARSEG
jgi:hypothetical protein